MNRLITIFLLFILSFSASSQNADIDLLKNINLRRNKNLDPTFRLITNSVSPLSIGTPILILSIGLITQDSALTHKGLFIAETVLGAAFISNVLKYSINRPRPFTTYSFIENVTSAGSPSFPSGHTSDAFALATSISIAFPKWYVIVPSLLWATSVGYSRMDLGVHYPSDVFAGALVGAGSAYLCSFINKKIFQKKHNHSNSLLIGK